MKKLFLCISITLGFILILKPNVVNAQVSSAIGLDQSGMLLRVKNSAFDNVVGSPYLIKDWTNGSVKFFSADPIQNVSLKLDLMENLLVVKGKNDQENLFDTKVSEFTLNDSGKERLFRAGFTSSKNIAINAYFEVLYDGKTKFLFRELKSIIESTGYNTSTITKNISSAMEYYISKADNVVNVVKVNEKSILAILNKPELAIYVKDNKLNLKSTADIVKLLQYYDTL